jgi:DNA-binding MarR family transcriptional regulator
MDGLPVIDQPAHRSGALIEYLARRMRLRAEAVLAPLGLRPRHLVALTVLRQSEGITQQALASRLMLDGTNVVGLLNELEADALIERRRSPTDRRRHIVELTQQGIERLAKAEFALAAAEDDVLAALGHDEREQLFALLQRATAISGDGCLEAGIEQDIPPDPVC